MNLKKLLMRYRNDYDTIKEIYNSPRGKTYHLGYLTALEKIIKDLEEVAKNG